MELDEYVDSLMKHESKIVWYDQRDFRMKTDIKKDKSLWFDQSDKCFELALGIQTCVKVVPQITMFKTLQYCWCAWTL